MAIVHRDQEGKIIYIFYILTNKLIKFIISQYGEVYITSQSRFN